MSNNSSTDEEVRSLKRQIAERKAAKLRNRLQSLHNNNNSNVPILSKENLKKIAEANEAYRIITRAPSRSASRASSPARSQTPGRRSLAELANNRTRKVANFNKRRNNGTLGRSRYTINERRARLVQERNAAIAKLEEHRSKSVSKNELKRAQAAVRNETKRAQAAVRERAAAEAARKKEEEKAKRAANKAAGIPKPPPLSANAKAAAILANAKARREAIEAKARANAEAIEANARAKIAREEERAARRQELERRRAAIAAATNQQKVQASISKAGKERADLEAKCAALQALKNREARGE